MRKTGEGCLKVEQRERSVCALKADLIDSKSTSTMLLNMECPGRNPCAETHSASSGSHLKRAALAISLLSQLTTDHERVLTAE